MSGTVLYRDLRGVDDVAEQHRYVAYWLDEYWERNQSPIQRLNHRFQIASGALVAQILFWSLAISGTIG